MLQRVEAQRPAGRQGSKGERGRAEGRGARAWELGADSLGSEYREWGDGEGRGSGADSWKRMQRAGNQARRTAVSTQRRRGGRLPGAPRPPALAPPLKADAMRTPAAAQLSLGSWVPRVDLTRNANAGSALAPSPARICLPSDIFVAFVTKSVETLK